MSGSTKQQGLDDAKKVKVVWESIDARMRTDPENKLGDPLEVIIITSFFWLSLDEIKNIFTNTPPLE